MHGARGTAQRRTTVAAAVLATVLGAAGCGPDAPPDRPAASGADAAAAAAPSWEFLHVADFRGRLTDVAALAGDDVWAVGTEDDGEAVVLLHHDGARWTREPLPEALGDVRYPPRLEAAGTEEVWLVPAAGSAGNPSWARWDGARWSALPGPPRDADAALHLLPAAGPDIEVAGPDDAWVLAGPHTAVHWDGGRWTPTRLPHPAADLAVAGPDDVWAVGHRTTGPGTEYVAGLPYAQPASAHWDGTSWKPVETPRYRFDEPLPAEPGASLDRVLALDGGEVIARGSHTFNHGELENEPRSEDIRLRWDDSRWVGQEPPPGRCDRAPVARVDGGLLVDGHRYLTGDGRCVRIGLPRLPASTGAGGTSKQSLRVEGTQRVPGTGEWLAAGHVRVDRSGGPFSAPVVVRLRSGGS
ncbi:hypothetical protein [Streptomyces sp. NPDC002640]